MSKPVFRHDLHKKLWDIIANHPGLRKEQAFLMLAAQYDEPIDYPDAYCFACEAVYSLVKNRIISCVTSACPLDWRMPQYTPGECVGCAYNTEDERVGLFAMWEKAMDEGDEDACAKLAAQIRDLPLKHRAYELYNVVSDVQ